MDDVVEVSFGSANEVVVFTADVEEDADCVDVDVSTGASSVDSRVVEEGVEETVVDDEFADGSDEVVGVGISPMVVGAVEVAVFDVCVVEEDVGCVVDVVETGFVVVDGMLWVVVDGTDGTIPSGGSVESVVGSCVVDGIETIVDVDESVVVGCVSEAVVSVI